MEVSERIQMLKHLENVLVNLKILNMLNFLSLIFNKNKKNLNNKVIYTLLYKEQFKYLKTTHSYHLVDPSPWRAVVRPTILFITQRTQQEYDMFLWRKLPMRNFYVYDCFGIAC